MEIYFDNAATTKPYPEVLDIYRKTAVEHYGNPSALHKLGIEAEHAVENARKVIADSICAQKEEIYFTSGGTESDNMAIIGTALSRKRQGNHIITSGIEHHAVLKPCAFLEEHGFEVTYLDADADGKISLKQLEEAIRPSTILISVMLVNNETGVLQPVERIKSVAPQVVLHTDAVQAYGKMKIDVQKLGVDLLSLSGHKVHGPKGIGVLYIKKGTKIRNINFGGGQEQGMRSGTLNVPAIAGLGKATALLTEHLTENSSYLAKLREYFVQELKKEIKDVIINGAEGIGILNVSFLGVRPEVLLHSLEEKGIYISAGSACTSRSAKVSHVLKGMHVSPEIAASAVRISFSTENTKQEIDYFIQELKKILEFLRKFKRR